MKEGRTIIPDTELLDLLLDAVCLVDEEGVFLFASAAAEQVFGYTPEEMVGKHMLDLIHPDDIDRTLKAAKEVVAGTSQFFFENRYVRKNGETVYLAWSARWSVEHNLRIAVARDITRRKRAESIQSALYTISAAALTAQDLPALYREIHRTIGALMAARNFFVALYDCRTQQVSYPYFVDERYPPPVEGVLDPTSRGAKVILSGEPLLISSDTGPGHAAGDMDHHPGSWLGVPLKSDNEVVGMLVAQSYAGGEHYSSEDCELLQFVSNEVAAAIARRTMLTRLEFMAQHDALTKLPNRTLFMDRLHNALARAERYKSLLALLFIDLDDFKKVNDSHGHATGDLLLEQVAQRLEGSVRRSDTAARLGGDEFIVLLERIFSPENAFEFAQKLCDTMNLPYEIDGHTILVPPSIGVAVYPAHGADAQQLLNHADQAMYGAKQRGGNRIGVYVAGSSRGG